MKERLRRFMTGRYGNDQLNQLLSTAALVLLILSLFTKWDITYWLSLFLLGLCYFRMLSKNTAKRYAENQAYLNWRYSLSLKKEQWKKQSRDRKTHHIYKCPSCGQKVRVPRGKGRISITCPKCKNSFIKNS